MSLVSRLRMAHKPARAPVPPRGRTLVLARRLDETQAARRERAVEAARSLAEAGGYAAVTMAAVADRAGISRATLYRYFASKDHLLAEVTSRWGAEIVAQLRGEPLRGRSAGARVARVFARVFAIAEAHPRLTEAAVTAALSAEPSAAAASSGNAGVVSEYLASALSDVAPREREAVARVLAHVFLAALVLLISGRTTARRAAAELAHAAQLLLARPRGGATPRRA